MTSFGLQTFLFFTFWHALIFAIDINPRAYIPSENKEQINKHSFSTVSLDQESPFIVEGAVHPQTGHLQRVLGDLSLPGLEPLDLQRSYFIHSTSHRGEILWMDFGFNHFSKLEKVAYDFELSDGLGSNLIFSGLPKLKDGVNYHRVIDDIFEKGMMNCTGGIISAKSNLKKLKLSKNGSRYLLEDGTGSKKHYKKFGNESYYLNEEVRASGNKIHYKYSNSGKLQEVQAFTKNGELINSFKFHFYDEKIDGRKFFDIKASNGRKVRYHLTQDSDNHTYKLADVYSDIDGHEHFSSKSNETAYDWVKFGKPDDRFISYDFYKMGDNHVNGRNIQIHKKYEKNKNNEQYLHGRVKAIKAPVGHDNSPIVTHSFVYNLKLIEEQKKEEPKKMVDPEAPREPEPQTVSRDRGRMILGGGSTDVFDAYGRLTSYIWNKEFRIRRLIRFTGKKDHKAYTKEHLNWGEGKQCHLLVSRCFEKEDYGYLFSRQFGYDGSGNVTHDELWGNLTGHSKDKVKLVGKFAIGNGTDRYVKQFGYSQDGYNNTTYETDGSYQIWYGFLRNSDILTSKLTGANNKILKREFYFYNERGELIQEMVDDGSDSSPDNLSEVKTRLITKHTPLNQAPFGFPKMKEHYYLDLQSGQEVFLGKSEYQYNQDGQVTQEDKFDSDGKFVMSATFEYDTAGNLILETNPLGHVIEREYDVHHNMLVERHHQDNTFKKIKYDFSNRPICVEEHHPNGVVLTVANHYDYVHNKVATIDIYGQKKSFKYDEFGRVIKEVHPEIVVEGGALVAPTSQYEYDVFGNMTKLTHPNGYEEYRRFNIRGQVAHSWDYEGTHEQNHYNLNGTLAKKIDCKGNETRLYYDSFKRVVKVEVYSPSKALLKELWTEWSAFNKTKEIDEKGIATLFFYDGANRLIEQSRGLQKTKYQYDSLGRLAKTLHYYGENEADFYSKCYEYDLLGQITEERIEDSFGNIQKLERKEYDSSGRVILTAELIEGKPALHKTHYNSFGLVDKVINPLGETTHFEYDFSFINEFGQYVLKTIKTDPDGTITETIHNTLGKPVSEKIKNSLGDLLRLTEYEYDISSNCTLVKASQIVDKEVKKQVLTRHIFDPQGRAIGLVEAYQSPLQKQTRLEFNAFNEKIKDCFSDGLEIYYHYDELGRLINYSASDNSFHYRYVFDNHALSRIDDLIHGSSTHKFYDANEYLSSEVLGNGIKLNYSVDRLGRTTKITLPDESSILYEYQGVELKKVKRADPSGKVLYEHHYCCYDTTGKVLKEELAFNLGRVDKSFDLLGRPTAVTSAFYQEEIGPYDLSSNITQKFTVDAVGKKTTLYNYDGLDQLIKEECGESIQEYRFDSLQNRLSKNGKDYQVNDLFELLDDGDKQYSYNAQGARILETSATKQIRYAYDTLGRLTHIVNDTATIDYIYDAENRRISRKITTLGGEATIERFIYVGQHEIGVIDTSNNIQQLRVLGVGLGAEIGASIAIELDQKVYVPLHDHIGNITALIDPENKSAFETYRYTSFGEESIYDSSSLAKSKSLNPWRFSSKRRDDETGFVYYGRRFLDTAAGRWISPDPKGYAAGPNLFAFVNNNPVGYFDLFGLEAEKGFFERTREWFSNLFRREESDTILDRAWNGIKSMCSFIERQVVLLPSVREVVRTAYNHVAKHVSFLGEWKKTNFSRVRQLHRPEAYENIRYIFINGILNFLLECKESAKLISEILGGFNVTYVHNSSHGVAGDSGESLLNKLGIVTRAACLLASAVRALAAEVGPEGTVVIVAHSQGAALTKVAMKMIEKNVLQQCVVATFGGASMISSEGLKDSVNYVSSKDPAPFMFDLPNIIRSVFDPKMKVEILKSNDTFGFGHSFDSSTYQSALKQFMRDIEDSYAK